MKAALVDLPATSDDRIKFQAQVMQDENRRERKTQSVLCWKSRALQHSAQLQQQMLECTTTIQQNCLQANMTVRANRLKERSHEKWCRRYVFLLIAMTKWYVNFWNVCTTCNIFSVCWNNLWHSTGLLLFSVAILHCPDVFWVTVLKLPFKFNDWVLVFAVYHTEILNNSQLAFCDDIFIGDIKRAAGSCQLVGARFALFSKNPTLLLVSCTCMAVVVQVDSAYNVPRYNVLFGYKALFSFVPHTYVHYLCTYFRV